MRGADVFLVGQVSNCPSHFQRAAVGGGAEAQPRHRRLQHLLAFPVDPTKSFCFFGPHLGVSIHSSPAKPFKLNPPRPADPLLYSFRALALDPLHNIPEFHLRHFDLNISPIKQRTGNNHIPARTGSHIPRRTTRNNEKVPGRERNALVPDRI